MKKITKEQLSEINSILKQRNYLERTDVQKLLKESGMCGTLFMRGLLENNIPFKSAKISVSLKSIGIINNGKEIEYDLIKNFDFWKIDMIKNSKIQIKYICKICNKDEDSTACNMIQRKFFSMEPICSKCILKEVTNTEEWKKTNSDAQFIAQNKPEQIEKNKQAQLKRFEDPKIRELYIENGKKLWENIEYREKKSKIALDKWDDPEYARKVIENSKTNFKTGFYKGIYYNSGYELAFLLKSESEDNFDKVKRPYFFILYKDKKGIARHYYPDFIFDDNILIEVKGYGPWVDLDNLSLKNKAAKKWCKENGFEFRVVEKQDLQSYYIKKAKQVHDEIKIEENNKI